MRGRPTQELDRRAVTFLTSTPELACPRSVRQVALWPVGGQFAKLPHALLEVVLQWYLSLWYVVFCTSHGIAVRCSVVCFTLSARLLIVLLVSLSLSCWPPLYGPKRHRAATTTAPTNSIYGPQGEYKRFTLSRATSPVHLGDVHVNTSWMKAEERRDEVSRACPPANGNVPLSLASRSGSGACSSRRSLE